MIIEVIDSKKKLRKCDLNTPKDCTYIKSIITRSINNENYKKLDDLRAQLEKEPNDFANDQLKRIKDALENKPNAKIIIKAKRASYDINDPKDKKNLQATIKRYYKADHFDSIHDIEQQVDKLLEEHKQNEALTTIKNHLTKLNNTQEEAQNYQPYTELLRQEFTLDERKPNDVQKFGYHVIINKIKKYEDENNVTAYLSRAVSDKKKTGQDNVEELTASFWFDYLNNSNFFSEVEDRARYVMYLLAVRAFFSHNASYYPAQGYGKSSLEECKNPLFYLRSQTKHHDVKNYKNYKNGSGNFGPQNSEYIRFINHSGSANPSYRKKMQKITKEGSVGEGSPTKGYGGSIIHAGTRANNVELYKVAMEDALIGPNDDRLKRLLKTHFSISQLAKEKRIIIYNKLSINIAELLGGFANLQHDATLYLNPKVYSSLMDARSHSAKLIANSLQSEKLKHMQVTHPDGSNLLYIDLYPKEFLNKIKESDNIKQGLTNMLLGFLTGLINYNAQKQGLFYLVQRRQSFGFLRPTVTDAGSLRVRLSLGANPATFEKLIIDSIKEFDTMLNDFDFVEPNQSKQGKDKGLVTQATSVSENSKGKNATDRTGVYNLSAMRVEDDQWIAILVSQKYLQRNNTKEEAFQEYLEHFIINRVKHNQVAKSDHYSISRKGYTLKPLASKVQNDQEVDIKNYPIFLLLQNVITTTVYYINTLDNQAPSSTLFHILEKLYHNCQKGLAILSKLNDYEISHLIAKSALLIENIQEYIIPLRCLVDNLEASKSSLENIDKSRFSEALNVSAEQTEVFYNDGGQQAVNTAIMAMFRYGMKSMYLFSHCYYEIPLFCSEAGFKQMNVECAEIWFCDITNIDILQNAFTEENSVKSIIIDITHNSSTYYLDQLRNLVQTAQEKGIIITFCCSTLKHEQLCQDKYQSGRNVFILPKQKLFNNQVKKDLEKISNEAMNPLLASFRQIVETITQEAPSKALQMFGMFKLNRVEHQKDSFITDIGANNNNRNRQRP